jgi:hypothetical protein
MRALERHTGSWTGSTAFRLTPDDEPHVSVSSMEVSLAATGLLTQLAYTWSHAQDGERSGLLVLGNGEDENTVVALWCDDWHQRAATWLTGRVDQGVVEVSCTYAGDWEWVIVVDATDADTLSVRMDNVVPESAAAQGYPPGAYWAMRTELVRRP